jgi:aminocarboxymuconate-semialdehyde decarboxylase
MKTVDVHAHLLLPEIEQAIAGHPGYAEHLELDARRNGRASLEASGQMMVERLPRLTLLVVRLSDMDAAGVDIQIVSPAPSHYHYWADEEPARMISRIANEGIAAHCARAPNRLYGLGLVPLQHPDLAVTALEDAMERGLKGVEISSHAEARELSDPDLEPFWTRAEELQAVVFLHPFGCTLDERLDRWYLSNIVGQPVENAVALSHLIFSGVLDRHPELRILAAHGGGYLPTYLGRADHGWAVRPEAHGCREPPSTYLRRLRFDSVVYDPGALRHLVDAVGADRVLLGSDHPFDMGVDDPVERLRAADLPPPEYDAVRGGNAVALFDLLAVKD